MPEVGRWEEILEATPEPVGIWLRLPPMSRSALVAYVAGPGLARGELVVPATAHVRVETWSGAAEVQRSSRPLTADDVDDQAKFTAAYLALVGVEPLAGFYRWSVLLPSGMDGRDFERLINHAADGPVTAADPAADAADGARRIASAVARVLGVPNPLHDGHGDQRLS